MDPILSLSHLKKYYSDQKAVDDISFDIQEGSIFGLLGPNGAGKTTLLRMITGIFYPDSGNITLDGKAFDPINDIQKIGYMPEERGLYKKMKIGEQALYLAQLKGLSKADATDKIKYWFKKFEMESWWNKKVEDLSKGMSQKLQFVTTILHEPKLIILDEPFSGLDPVNANLIKDEIFNLAKKGSTIIFSTHRMEQVEEICDQIVLVNLGKKILDGTLLDIKRAYPSKIFRVGIKSEDKALAWQTLEDSFGATPMVFKSIHDEVQCHVHLPDQMTPNDLFMQLSQLGQINHFVQEVPTANDIFIQSIHQNEASL